MSVSLDDVVDSASKSALLHLVKSICFGRVNKPLQDVAAVVVVAKATDLTLAVVLIHSVGLFHAAGFAHAAGLTHAA